MQLSDFFCVFRKSKQNHPAPLKVKTVSLPTHLRHCLAVKAMQHRRAARHFENILMKNCVITKMTKVIHKDLQKPLFTQERLSTC